MSSKYSIGDHVRERHRSNRPQLSKHVVGGGDEGFGRWAERMPDDSISPEAALDRAFDISEVSRLPAWRGEEGIEVRCYPGETRSGEQYIALFVVADPSGQAREECFKLVLTCFRCRDVDSGPIRSYIHGRAGQHGYTQEAEL